MKFIDLFPPSETFEIKFLNTELKLKFRPFTFGRIAELQAYAGGDFKNLSDIIELKTYSNGKAAAMIFVMLDDSSQTKVKAIYNMYKDLFDEVLIKEAFDENGIPNGADILYAMCFELSSNGNIYSDLVLNFTKSFENSTQQDKKKDKTIKNKLLQK